MTTNVYTEILKGRNQCALTGVETQIHTSVTGAYRITAHRDNYGQIRVTAKCMTSYQNVSAILYDADCVCRFRFTDPNHRQKRLTKQLHAYTMAFVNRKVRHSSHLTESGVASL